MRNDKVVLVRRGDYRAPSFLVDRVELEFDLDPESTLVTSTLTVRRNSEATASSLWLDGEDLEFVSIEIDGHAPDPGTIDVRIDGISVVAPADSFVVRISNRTCPASNTELIGLYVSNGNFFTQCEAEGFRRISYFPDRPDVMAPYRVIVRAERARYPILLANGNLIDSGELPGGRHYAVWDDPFPKPSYLFATVAGNFVAREETIVRASGRDALLQVWVEPGNLDKTEHAMASLKRAIRWDEERFGLELDLDRFMIVASNDYNMGAMENKGLNIFNAKYVLANPAVATDIDHANIESIVGHEYFHNWTGNRVTCRDWFQLSLKEGLTVFRDQEFSADMMGEPSNRSVKRIDDVRALRATQFPEDAGPMAHPVRPDTYQEISNFYTATVYEKGAEVVRMLQTLVGTAGFRSGLDLYFKRHDGQAVTCDDFVAAIGDANGRDLVQFRRWYSQAGTPHVTVTALYDAVRRIFELNFTQNVPPTPGQPTKEPMAIPFAVGLVGSDGRDLPLRLEGEAAGTSTTRLLELVKPTQTFRFVGISERPIPSLLRGFCAPVIVDFRYSDSELAFLSAHDSDPFNRWEAGQRLATVRLLALTDAVEGSRELALDEPFVQAFRATLLDPSLAPAFKEQALTLPSEGFIGEQRAVVDPEAIRVARRFVVAELGRRLAGEWVEAYENHRVSGPYSPNPSDAGRRALRNLALHYLVEAKVNGALERARHQLREADNMTERQGALTAIANSDAPDRAEILIQLARDWHDEPLLMNKWYQVQATAVAHRGEPPVVDRVRRLMAHPGFSLANPNNVYALLRSFFATNEAEFHRRGAGGYALWTEQVLALDRLNPTVAARIARALDRWRKFTPDRRDAMEFALKAVAGSAVLSRDVREIVTKSLEN